MKFNQSIARYLFGFGLREKKLTIIMDLMFEIINIKDNFILDRLYLLMGYPEMILKQQIKEEKNEDENENENEEGKNNKTNYKMKYGRFALSAFTGSVSFTTNAAKILSTSAKKHWKAHKIIDNDDNII